jgi:beta-glucosidase
MSLEQKINEIRGLQPEPIDGLYHAGGDEELKIPVFTMVDGPRGARAGKATAFPVGIARGATFDVELERRVGLAIGLEVQARGGNVLLAPTINLLRHPGWGRAQETYSEDPYHMGAMSVSFISGAQNHVLASPKHFAVNNIENTRFEMSANVDLRTLHEVYLPHFKRSVVEAKAASVMSAYNKVNGVYCGENPDLLTDILRDDWGFDGFVESDWFLGTRSVAPALVAGLDIEMPHGFRFSDENLTTAMADGDLTEDTIDSAVRRILRQKYRFRLDEVFAVDSTLVECEEHVALAAEVARKSMVLLKNDNHVLPLDAASLQEIAIIGALADMENLGDRGSSFVSSSSVVTALEGIKAAAPALKYHHIDSYHIDDSDAQLVAQMDAVIIVAGLTYKEEGEFIPTQQQESEEGELARGGDRLSLGLPVDQEDLIKKVSGLCSKTIVVLEGGSAIQVREWIDEIPALLIAWYPGREGGTAIGEIVFGRVNPSGKLPVSFPRQISDLVEWDIQSLDISYEFHHGYRLLDLSGRVAEFPFGFGLSYTHFELNDLKVIKDDDLDDQATVLVSVTNIGERSGDEVVQLYIGCKGSAVERHMKELKGFGRVSLAAGESKTLAFTLSGEDMAYYNARQRQWCVEDIEYQIFVGTSASDLPLTTTLRFGN